MYVTFVLTNLSKDQPNVLTKVRYYSHIWSTLKHGPMINDMAFVEGDSDIRGSKITMK